MSTAWLSEAACRGMSADLFFPERGESTRESKDACAECPVTAECLDFALVGSEKFGVWGGMSERQRRRIRVSRGLRKPGGQEVTAHGTQAAYRRHLRNGESCVACRNANAERRAISKERLRLKRQAS